MTWGRRSAGSRFITDSLVRIQNNNGPKLGLYITDGECQQTLLKRGRLRLHWLIASRELMATRTDRKSANIERNEPR